MWVVLDGGRVDGVVGEAWWVMPQEEHGLGGRGSDGTEVRTRRPWARGGPRRGGHYTCVRRVNISQENRSEKRQRSSASALVYRSYGYHMG